MELETDKIHLAKIEDIQKNRRKAQKKKDKKSSHSASSVNDLDYHRISFPEFYKKIGIDENTAKNGLTNAEAIKRNQEQGDNSLSEKKKDPWYVMLFHEMTSFFSLLLWAGSILCFIAYGLDPSDPSNLYLGIVLGVVVFLTSLVTFF